MKTYVEFRKALLEYRNTPRYDGLSPAQWYYGRRQRKEAAALPSAYDRLSQEQLDKHKALRRKRRKEKHQATSATKGQSWMCWDESTVTKYENQGMR